MMRTFSRKAATVAGTSFLSALAGGSVIFGGVVGVQAAQVPTCTVQAADQQVTEFGHTQVTWTADGECGGVSVALTQVVDGARTVLVQDALDGDGTAQFVFGAVPAGTVYDFVIFGVTEETAAPVSLLSFAG
jgi:hypothetical protein